MQTRIEFDAARDEWVINGFKRYISNASVADVYIVYGVSDPAAPGGRGMSAVIVAAGTPGLSFPRRYTFMGRRGCVVGEVELREESRAAPLRSPASMPRRARPSARSSAASNSSGAGSRR